MNVLHPVFHRMMSTNQFTYTELAKMKIIGSSINSLENFNDIDIFTYDEALFSKLLFFGEPYHPTLIETELFARLESLSTFHNLSYCVALNGIVCYSPYYTEDKELRYNPMSALFFKNTKQIKKHLKKLLERGYTIDSTELRKLTIGTFFTDKLPEDVTEAQWDNWWRLSERSS